VCVEKYLQLIVLLGCGVGWGVYVCGLSKTHGKHGKHGMRCVKWLILKGLAFSVFYSVFYSVFRSVLPFTESLRVVCGQLSGSLWAGVRACFPQTLPLSQLLLTYPTGWHCRVRHGQFSVSSSPQLGCLTLHRAGVR